MTQKDFRSERDSLGEVAVPLDRYWGGQTERARINFAIRQPSLPRVFLRAYGLVKQAAAEVNAELSGLPSDISQAIETAAQEVVEGRLDAEFPLGTYQSGSGTQTNMNLNEVIAGRANEILTGTRGGKNPVHPNDHVNLSQSTNDSFPTAMHVAVALAVREDLLPELQQLGATLRRKSEEFKDIIKIGRTHLQDATPLSLGQEFSGWAAQVEQAAACVEIALAPVYALALGGTAVGTGLNAPASFGAQTVQVLAKRTGIPFVLASNSFAAISNHDPLVGLSGTLRQVATASKKIASDIAWLASGPRCGLGELQLPQNEPGSSIMPGKVNPSQCEVMNMICVRVFGNDATVGFAGTQGDLQLNTYKPLIISVLLESISLLSDGLRAFRVRCVDGIQPRRKQIEEHLRNSLMLVTSLNPYIGYDKAAEVAQKAEAEGIGLKEAALALGYLDEETFERLVRPELMISKP